MKARLHGVLFFWHQVSDHPRGESRTNRHLPDASDSDPFIQYMRDYVAIAETIDRDFRLGNIPDHLEHRSDPGCRRRIAGHMADDRGDGRYHLVATERR